MSRHFGAIRQLGYVVHDIEAAMDYWSKTLGVGPWFYNPKVPIKNYRYNGEAHEPHNSVALANSGYVQVELIQTRNDVPSMYRDFLQAGRTGLQHVAYWTSDYDADLERLLAEGYVEARVGDGTYVAQALAPRPRASAPALAMPPRGLSQRGQLVADTAARWRPPVVPARAFRIGAPEVASFPFAVWDRLSLIHR